MLERFEKIIILFSHKAQFYLNGDATEKFSNWSRKILNQDM